MSAVAAARGRGVTAVAAPAFGSTLTGTGKLIRFMLRRDRVRLIVWTGIFVLLYAASLAPGGEYEVLNDDAEAREARAALLNTPVMVALGGPGYGIDHYDMAAAVANELTLWIVLTLAVMSILQVVRHTRAEEESSRSELVRAGRVGRHAPAVAAMTVVGVWNLVIAVASGSVLAAMGLDAPESFVMTLAMGLGALVFAAVALVAAQVMESGGGAVGVSFAVLGIAYFVRTLGDLQEQHGSTLSWFSPISWVQQTRVFVDTRLWPLLLCLAAITLLLLLAGFLGTRRDFGAGLVAARPGRPEAAASLRGPMTLAWVRQRAGMLWTGFGLALFWLATGAILPEVPNMTAALGDDNPIYADMLKGSETAMIQAFAGIIGMYAALGAAAYAVVTGLRVKADEEAGRAEIVLAKPIGRVRWLTANTVVTLLGAFFVVTVGIFAMALGAAVGELEAISTADFAALAVAYLPPVALFVALAVAVYAWVPRATGVLWVVFGWSMVVGVLAEALGLPEWAQQISPFWWVSGVLADGIEWDRLAALGGIALALFVLALVGFRRRDVPTV